jgi:hypothetical protein
MEANERRAKILAVEAIASAMHAFGKVEKPHLRRWLGDAMDDATFEYLLEELKVAGYIKEDDAGLLIWQKK